MSVCAGKSEEEDLRFALLGAIENRLVRMAAYLGKCCGVDADDLQQDAWIAVLEVLPHVDMQIGIAEQHLLKRARWRMLDSIRRQRRRVHFSLDELSHLPVCGEFETTIDFHLLMERLKPVQQRILRALLEGYTWREAGVLEGCTSANIAYHVRCIQKTYLGLFSE